MWKDIVGHAGAIEELAGCIRGGRVPHAFLFAGPAGIGKTKAAIEFFKALNCLKSPGDPCDSCRSCVKAVNDSHPDLRSVAPEEDKKWIQVQAVRDIIAETGLKPYEARSRVIVIEPAECLNKESANALLKTLEEPPEGSLIILVSHKPSLLLPTIVSRCRIIRFTPPDASSNARGAVDPVILRLTSGTLGGLPGREQGDVLEIRSGILKVLRGGDPVALVNRYIPDPGGDPENLSIILLIAESILRDLLILSHGGDAVINEELGEFMHHGISHPDAEDIAGCIEGIRRGVNENISQRPAASELLIRLKQAVPGS